MADRIQHRRDTAERWASFNPILLEGEVGYVLDNPNQHKIGDGIHAWNDLPMRGFNGNITQDTGDDENAVMSQKATTEKLAELGQEVRSGFFYKKGYIQEAIPKEFGSGTTRCSIYFIKGYKYRITNNGADAVYAIICDGDTFLQNIGNIDGGSTREFESMYDANIVQYYRESGNHTLTIETLSSVTDDIEQLNVNVEGLKNTQIGLSHKIGGSIQLEKNNRIDLFDDGGKWVAATGYNSYLIEANCGALYKFTASSNGDAIVSFVKNIGVNGGSIEYGEGTKRIKITAGESAEYISPSDAKYLCVAKDVNSVDRTPSIECESSYEKTERINNSLQEEIKKVGSDISSCEVIKYNDSGEVYSSNTISTTRKFKVVKNGYLSISQLSEYDGIELRVNWYSASMKLLYQTTWQKYSNGHSVSFTTREGAEMFSISYRHLDGEVYDTEFVLPSKVLYTNYKLEEVSQVYCIDKEVSYPNNILVDFIKPNTNYEVTLYLRATTSNQYIHLMNIGRDKFMIKQYSVNQYDAPMPYTFTINSETINPMLIVLYNGLGLSGIEIKDVGTSIRNHRIVDYAHLGYGAYYPYNTIVGFVGAIKSGFKGIVANVVETSDGELMCYHDNDAHLTNDNGQTFVKFSGDELRSMTSDELRSYDAGLIKGEKFKGEKVPYVKDFISLCANNGVYISLSIHPDLTENGWNKLYTLLLNARMLEKTTIKSFEPYSNDGSYPNFIKIYKIFGEKVRYGFDCNLSKGNIDSFIEMDLGHSKKLMETAISQINDDNIQNIEYAVKNGLDVSVYDAYYNAGTFAKVVKMGVSEITSDNYVVAGSWIY